MKTRKPQILLLLVLLASLTLGGLSPIAAQDVEPPRRAPGAPSFPSATLGSEDGAGFKLGEVLVKFKSQTPARSVDSLMARFQANRLTTLEGVDVQVWQVPEGKELDITEQLKAESTIEYAQPNYVYYALGIPNDAGYQNQWGLTKVRAPLAWDVTQGSNAITIAIVDTGIDLGHPDLAAKIVAGWDYVSNDSVPQDENGHGTHVAGIAAAIANNYEGVAGMNWNARIMPVRVLDQYGQGYTGQIAAGILWAAQHGAKVINLSLGGIYYDATMQDAINQAHNAGSLVVAAMGNCRTECEINGDTYVNPTVYPAANTNVMAVAATGPTDQYAYYSQYGPHCDIAAPGGEMTGYHDPDGIYSTMPTYPVELTTHDYFYAGYDFLQGTSQATPFVAGLAALVWATNPGLSPDQVQAVIQDTAVDLGTTGKDPNYGWGRIDALAAVSVYGIPVAPVISSINNSDGNGDYTVAWSTVTNATSYELQEDDNSQFGSPATIYTGPASQYPVSGKSAGPWYYRVRARNSAGSSPWSGIQGLTVKPAAPVLNSITNSGNEDAYLIAWSPSAYANSYTLQESDTASFSSPVTRYMGTDTQYQVTGQGGGTWYYRVRASNAGGDSDWSTPPADTTVVADPVDPPAFVDTQPDGSGTYTVDWDDAGDAYILEESRDPWFSAPTVVYSGPTSTYSVTDQPQGTWYYRVRATTSAGTSPWSAAQSVSVMTRLYIPVAFRALEIRESFDSGVMPPSGWSQIISDTNFLTTTWYIDSEHPYTPPYDAACDFDPTGGRQDEVLLSPSFQLSSGTVSFESQGSLYWCRDVFQNCSLDIWLVVGEMGGPDDIFIYRANQDWLGTFVWSPSSVDMTPYLLPNTPTRVAFQYFGKNGAQISLDSIVISGN